MVESPSRREAASAGPNAGMSAPARKVAAVAALAAALAAMASSAILLACSPRPGPTQASAPVEWRLVPEATVLGDRRQFFVYGRHLDSARVTAADGVAIEQGWVKEDGKVLSLYLTVGPLGPGRADSAYLVDKPGLRKLRIRTRDTVVVLPLKVLDETER